jgi:hypothetical protein
VGTETEIVDLRRELARARLRTDIAVHLIPQITDVVEDHDVRMVVVNDVATCWALLPAAVLATYAKPRFDVEPLRTDGPEQLPVGRFVDDYTNEVDRTWTAVSPPTCTLTEAERHERCLAGWYDFVVGICERTAAGEPPPAEWLARFPAADEFVCEACSCPGRKPG